MDRNLFLAFALSFAVLLLWTVLVEPPRRPQEPPPSEEAREAAAPEAAAVPAPEVPEPPAAEAPAPALPEAPSQTLVVENSRYRAELESRGAGIAHWELKEYHTRPDEGREPIVLTTFESPDQLVLRTDFSELGLGDLGRRVFDVVERRSDEIAFSLEQGGVRVDKRYRFDPEGYGLVLAVEVHNGSSRAITPEFRVRWPAAAHEGQDFREQSLAVLHEGSVTREALQSLGKPGFFGGGEQQLDFPREVDWAGMSTNYFVAAVAPDSPSQANARILALVPGEMGEAQVFFDPVMLPPGASASRVFRAYLGPKEPEQLEAFGAGLIQSVDFGWSWIAPLTRFFGWLLGAIYAVIPNYGLAIIALTILVRVVTTPLTAKQMRSMERMRALAPKLQELKEKHGDDRQKQSEEMMRLYRQEGVNPLGGCFPMLLQLPVFVGLFYALRSSIQLRQAPFVGWIDDLSAPETLFVIPGLELPFRLLPLVMGGTMVLQQKITPMQQMDPTQQRMMMVMMPVMMTVISWTFPSGLVLYWMVSNVLAVGHQLWIGRDVRQKAPRKGGAPQEGAAGQGGGGEKGPKGPKEQPRRARGNARAERRRAARSRRS